MTDLKFGAGLLQEHQPSVRLFLSARVTRRQKSSVTESDSFLIEFVCGPDHVVPIMASDVRLGKQMDWGAVPWYLSDYD